MPKAANKPKAGTPPPILSFNTGKPEMPRARIFLSGIALKEQPPSSRAVTLSIPQEVDLSAEVFLKLKALQPKAPDTPCPGDADL